MGAVDLGQFEFMAVTEGKPYNRACGPWEMPPLLPPSAASPPEGEICSTLRIQFHK